MKKILPIIYCFLAILFLNSCGGHFFNPRYYYNKSSSSSSGAAPDTGPEAPPEQVPEHEDPFKNGNWNDPTYGGYNGSKFDSWLFKASFQADKLPIYNFFDDSSRSWIPGGSDWNNISAEYYDGKDGENTVKSGPLTVSVTGLKVYKYPGNNPLYSSAGYLPGRMDRFNFYSINGKASVATLKQYLIAVDTYSKFIFAFGAITGTESVMGDEVPIQFEAIEKHGEKRPFFEYDPIGYVKEDGSVVLYEHYRKEFVDAPTKYQPKIHPEFETMATHTENGQGSSPYLKVDVSTIDPSTILDNFKNKQYGIRDKLILYTYKFDTTANTLTLKSEHFYDGPLSTKIYTFSKVAGLTAAEYVSSSGETIIVNGIDDYKKLKDGDSLEYILNYSDDGPLFRYRVAGKTYKAENGSYEYRFNPDGTSLDYYVNNQKKSSYTFSQQDASDRAVYREDTAKYWGLRLADHEKDGSTIKDGVLYWSGSPWASPETTPTKGVTSTPGYLNVNIIKGGFTENVKGKKYQYRDYSEYDISSPLPEDYKPTGKSLILYGYEFSSDAQSLTISEETWNSGTVSKKYNIVSSSDSSAIYEYNGAQITVSIQTDNNVLYKDGVVVGTTSFTDYGPIFADRVRGARFFKAEKEDITIVRTVYNVEYIFNEDATKVVLTYSYSPDKYAEETFNYTLARYDNDANNNYRAVYESAEAGTAFKYSWIELSNNDNTVKVSRDYGAIGTPGSFGGVAYEAYRQNK